MRNWCALVLASATVLSALAFPPHAVAATPELSILSASEPDPEPTTDPAKKKFVLEKRLRAVGTKRFTHTVKATAPRFDVRPERLTWRWLRDGRTIRGATTRTHRLGRRDVGHQLRAQVIATRSGYERRSVRSKAYRVEHRVPAHHTVHYTVETRGKIVANLRRFRRLSHASLNDPRGWRGAGIAFREVSRGGSMTLVLAEPSWVPKFSSGCSSQWSCRVGRYVIINQMRWRFASPAWMASNGSLRGYRHMVVNHETGHWLGWSHRSCPRAGAPAPVMMQQSISLQGCRFNPFPTPAERNVPRF